MEKNGRENSNDEPKKKYHFRVVCRVRPASQRELAFQEADDGAKLAIAPNNQTISLTLSKDQPIKSFQFEKIFTPETTAQGFFENIAMPTVHDLLHGVSSTLIAYGQTCSGKTYSIFGTDTVPGLIPLSGQLLFSLINDRPTEQFKVTCSFYEIYNERLYDLWDPNEKELRIREDVNKGIYVEDSSEKTFTNAAELDQAIAQGNRQRHVLKTLLNEPQTLTQCRAIRCTRMSVLSSRSHVILLLTLHREHCPPSTITFVDLAGSERAKHTFGSGLREAANINKSLASLRNCLTALVGHKRHVPYRDSKLTRLLTTSLSGGIKTTFILTCSPHHSNIEETLHTMRLGHMVHSPRLGGIVFILRTILTPMDRGLFVQLPSELVQHTMCLLIGEELLTHKQSVWLVNMIDKRLLHHTSLRALWHELISLEL